MTVAEMIKKTRLDNNMTQEEYGCKFGVTRQTVSSWENEKSMPDLQMLITICNTYHLSLDLLLNDDYGYVYKIDIMQKIGRILKKFVYVLLIMVGIFLIMFAVWNVNAKEKNTAFASRVLELGFVLEDGHYILEDQVALYELPNQKLPFMKNHFYAQHISATYRNEYYACKIRMSYDTEKYSFTINYGAENNISGIITDYGHIEYQELSKQDLMLMDKYQDDIESILHKMVEYYKVAYDL